MALPVPDVPVGMNFWLLSPVTWHLPILLCPECGAEMRVIAVIQDKPIINKILESVGEATQPPSLSPTRGPPGWDDYDQNIPVDENGLSVSEYEFDQCVSW